MKIYFEDGALKDAFKEIPEKVTVMLDAKYGYNSCDHELWKLTKINYNAVVYTNAITALSNRWAWNEELKVPEIYIRNKDGIFTRIDELTPKMLREGHNIMRMYIAGAFGNFD